MWNNAIDHVVHVSQSSSSDGNTRRRHKELLLYHGFGVNPESDNESDDGET
jgi:hypothetical protein